MSRWFYVFDADRIGRKILTYNLQLKSDNWVIDAQDPFECGLAAYRISRRKKIPLHIQIHTDLFSPYFKSFSFLNSLRVMIAKHILRRASAVRVVSQRIKNSLIQVGRISIPESKITVLPIYTDIERYGNAQASFDLKQKYPQWSFIIVAVGRFSEEKNFGLAIRILKRLLKNYPKTGLVIVGDGPMKKFGCLARFHGVGRAANLCL
jgi:glycosyltransferase involved in cell wall biosynthesis